MKTQVKLEAIDAVRDLIVGPDMRKVYHRFSEIEQSYIDRINTLEERFSDLQKNVISTEAKLTKAEQKLTDLRDQVLSYEKVSKSNKDNFVNKGNLKDILELALLNIK